MRRFNEHSESVLTSSVGDVLYEKKEDGRYSRMWGAGSDKAVTAKAGFDLERAIWEDVLEVNCQKSMLEECERLRDFFDLVFANQTLSS